MAPPSGRRDRKSSLETSLERVRLRRCGKTHNGFRFAAGKAFSKTVRNLTAAAARFSETRRRLRARRYEREEAKDVLQTGKQTSRSTGQGTFSSLPAEPTAGNVAATGGRGGICAKLHAGVSSGRHRAPSRRLIADPAATPHKTTIDVSEELNSQAALSSPRARQRMMQPYFLTK